MEEEKAIQIFKNTWFVRFAKREKITDDVLKKVIDLAEQGLINADLGGGVIKQRLARPGQGKSGGFRTIIVFKKGDKAFFVYGFSKSERENLEKDELAAFKQIAKELLSLSGQQLEKLLEKGMLTEIEE